MRTSFRNMISIMLLALISFTVHGDNIPKSNNCNEQKPVEMKFSYNEETNTIKISFAENDVQKNDPEQWEYFKTHTTYPFEEEFPLPEDMWKSMGATRPLIIKTGVYPLIYKNGQYEITITL